MDRTGNPGAADRSWIVGERDAGARQRDQAADQRDAIAEARDAVAAERDRLADAREAELDELAARLALGPADDGQHRAPARAQRERAGTERERRRSDRAAAASRAGAARGRPADESDDADDGERAWADDKRDFVADWRDYLADLRDADADARDALADERDHQADTRDAEFDGHPDAVDDERARARTARGEARRERERQRSERVAAATIRTQTAQLRTDATPVTGLAMAFAEIARHLYDAVNLDDVLARITRVTVATVPGCEMASITVRPDDGTFLATAATHPTATEVDQAQYRAGEGPCVTAVEEAIVYTPDFPDPRWPALGSRPVDAGVRSAVSYSLAAFGPAEDTPPAGSLTAYAGAIAAFDDEAREIGLILAAHASIALRAVGERGALEQLGRELHAALSSRDVIGQAKGILMERLRITPEDAFDTLRRSSQRLNVKLRDLAEKLAETGEFDGR